MERNDFMKLCKEEYLINGKSKLLQNIENWILESKNPWLLVEFLLVTDEVDLKKFEDIIIESKKPMCIYSLALHAKDANIERLQDTLLSLKDDFALYRFAKKVKGADIDKIENFILERHKDYNLIRFARGVKGANISKFQKIILNHYKISTICDFANEVEGVNIEEIEDFLIQKNNLSDIVYFADKVKSANIRKLEDYIISSNIAEHICNFAFIENADINKLQDAIIKTKDIFYLYNFTNVKGSDKEKIGKAIKDLIVETKESKLMLVNEKELKNFILKCDKEDACNLIDLFNKEVMAKDKNKMKSYLNKTKIGVVIFTGIGETVDGYNNKYKLIAEYWYMKKKASVFIVPVTSWSGKTTLIEEIMTKIDEYYKQIQIEDYELYLMGLSAGASFIVNEHYKYNRVKKVLAINPVLNVNLDKMILALNQSQIPLTFVFAEKDPSCIFLKLIDLEKGGKNKVEIIEGADHEFSEHFEEFLFLPEKYFF